MKKILSLFLVVFACTLFTSQLYAQTPPTEVYAGNQVQVGTVFSVNFGTERCLGYSVMVEKITPSNTGLIYFKFVELYASPGQSFRFVDLIGTTTSTGQSRGITVYGKAK